MTMSAPASSGELNSTGLRGLVVLAIIYNYESQISTVKPFQEDVHNNNSFNEIVLIDMPSCSTCPAVAETI